MIDRWVQTGPRDAKIVLVGEAPGETEERSGVPFTGGADELLDRMLGRAGILRSQIFITNLCHVRPAGKPSNDFKWFTRKENQHHLVRGILRLKQDLEEIRPNVVVALGSFPLQFLTGKVGISKWRGSILPCALVPGLKVVGTYHPAAVLRVYEDKVVSEFDLKRVKQQSAFSEIIMPERTFYLPTRIIHRDSTGMERARSYEIGEYDRVAHSIFESEWNGVDIECLPDSSGRWRTVCIAFADRADRGIVLTTDKDSLLVRTGLASSSKKVYQNGMFDYTVLTDEGMEPNGFHWDTMLAHHTLMPECASGEDEMSKLAGKKRKASGLAKGLAFQTSIYTHEPFYKDDGKLWAATNDFEKFWRYNDLDAMVTLEIRDVQAKELGIP